MTESHLWIMDVIIPGVGERASGHSRSEVLTNQKPGYVVPGLVCIPAKFAAISVPSPLQDDNRGEKKKQQQDSASHAVRDDPAPWH